MKKISKTLIAVLFLLSLSSIISAQNFKVTIPSTDDCNGLFLPTKAGGSIGPFKITVKNNDTVAWTVSIDKSSMGEVEPWVAIETNSLALTPGQQRDFLVTISGPSSAFDVN